MEEGSNNSKGIKVAFISVFNSHCGISTYSEYLVNALLKNKNITLKVFAEKTENGIDSDLVSFCWRRDEYPKFELIKQVEEFAPDVIHFQHEYGIYFPSYKYTSLVSYFKGQGFKIISTHHSVYDHLDKIVNEASSPNIIVHSESARDCLVKKGIKSNHINIIPHGSVSLTENGDLLENLWNTWGSNHTLLTAGFLFNYKGHIRLLDILAKLKENYSDCHLIILGSENPHTINEHNQVYKEIINKAKKLGLIHNITVNRGFVSQEVLLSYIRTVKCVVLPYVSHPDHNVRGSSGMSKIVLATKTPLVTSKVHLFDEVSNLALQGDTDEEIYNHIVNVFEGKINLQENLQARKNFLKETNWDKVADKLFDLYLKM